MTLNIWICGVLELSLSSASRICTASQQVIFFSVWWTHESLDMNARWSGHERTMVWTWTHDGLDMNARKSGNERTKIFRAFMSRLSCVHVQTIVRSPDHRAFMSRPSCVHVQTIVRSSVFPDRVILNARHPLRAFISVWTYLVSVWDLSLGLF